MSISASENLIREEGALPGPTRAYLRSVRPARDAWASLAVVHGYGDHSGRYLAFMEWMAERGVACGALDLRGHGRSLGRRGAVGNWADYLEDVRQLQTRADRWAAPDRPYFLLGHSHGGLVVVASLLQDAAGVDGAILSAPFLRNRMSIPPSKILLARLANPLIPWLPVASGVKHEWMTRDPECGAESRRDPLIHRVATPRWFLGCRTAQAEALRRAAELRVPLLVLMGEADPVADLAAVDEFCRQAGSADKTYHTYPDHLHELLRERGRETIYQHVFDWLRERAAALSAAPARPSECPTA